MTAVSVWIELVVAMALIVYAGGRLSRYAEIVGERAGLGSHGAGLVLLATITSLPELATGVSAVTLADSPDIAVGALLGSCVFNLLILAVLDFSMQRQSIYTRLSREHILSASFGILIIAVVGFELVLGGIREAPSGLGIAGYSTPLAVPPPPLNVVRSSVAHCCLRAPKPRRQISRRRRP